MKKNKIIAIVIIIVGIISIIGGGIFAFTSKDSEPKPKDEQKNTTNKPDKSYKTIVKLEKEEFNEIPEDDFESVVKEIGFREIDCNNGYCIARKRTYDDYSSADTINISYKEGSVYVVETSTYYHKKDYVIEDVVKNLNSVIQNYIGYSYTNEYFKKLDSKLNENIENDNLEDDYVSDKVYVGEYTLEMIILYIEDHYTIRTFLIKTEDYMQK